MKCSVHDCVYNYARKYVRDIANVCYDLLDWTFSANEKLNSGIVSDNNRRQLCF